MTIILEEYCWNSEHDGGWTCKQCISQIETMRMLKEPVEAPFVAKDIVHYIKRVRDSVTFGHKRMRIIDCAFFDEKWKSNVIILNDDDSQLGLDYDVPCWMLERVNV